MTADRRLTPVTIRGKTYPSHKAAADAFGTTRQAISMAKRRGMLDKVGLHPGDSATDAYIRLVMSDGKWRNVDDITSKAERDGVLVTVQGIGRTMARFVSEGFIRAEGNDDRRMWKLRRREAAE